MKALVMVLTIEGLAKLRAINPGGFVTAGNAPVSTTVQQLSLL